nr:AraC family transcriptional regulator [uncultured Dyadobacter sp.]
MKISVTDDGSGIALQFARAIGARVEGRFIHIPESKGAGYITGFSWGMDLRMMIRNYYLNEDVEVERTNALAEGQEDVVFMLGGIFPSLAQPGTGLLPEQANVLICKHAVSATMAMPSQTKFGSVTIAVSKSYLNRLFGHIPHPVVTSVLEARDSLFLETSVSSGIVGTAEQMLGSTVPESLEDQYYRLKCEELLCHIFAILMQREQVVPSVMHIDDVKAVYAIRNRLQAHPGEPPHISVLAREAGMSEPKLRKLFKQTFGKGVFEYYQSLRMVEAARLLREDRLSVSEVGYRLGFTNLSHFSRVFEQYMGIKPKKYAMG